MYYNGRFSKKFYFSCMWTLGHSVIKISVALWVTVIKVWKMLIKILFTPAWNSVRIYNPEDRSLRATKELVWKKSVLKELLKSSTSFCPSLKSCVSVWQKTIKFCKAIVLQ